MDAGRVECDGVRVSYLDSGSSPGEAGAPLVIVPGMLERAEDYEALMEALAPRRCVAISLRGRGDSDAPATGYSFDDQCGDVNAVLAHLGLANPVLFGFSAGVGFAFGVALTDGVRVAGMIAGDYVPGYWTLPQAWLDDALSHVDEHGVSAGSLRAMVADSSDVWLGPRLAELPFPVMCLFGQDSPMDAPEMAKIYGQFLPDAEVHLLADCGHDLLESGLEPVLALVRGFLARVDGAGD